MLLKARCISGVGYPNENGGVTFYSPLIGDIANIGEPGVTMLFSKKNQKSSSVCVFENFLDYLAYLMLMGLNKQTIDSDVLILNSVGNFLDGMLECETYRRVLCFFRRSRASVIMQATFLDRMNGISKDMSYIYTESGNDSLLDLIGTLGKQI